MKTLIKGFDHEFVIDIFVYAEQKNGFGMSGYELSMQGEKVESQIIRAKKKDQELTCVYMDTLQKSFLRAADFIGKYAIPIIDPQRNILVRKDERISDRSKAARKVVKFIFRFHIADERSMDIACGRGASGISLNEEKWARLFKLLKMNMSKPNLPYRNLRVSVDCMFRKCDLQEVGELADYVERELKHISSVPGANE